MERFETVLITESKRQIVCQSDTLSEMLEKLNNLSLGKLSELSGELTANRRTKW